MRRKSKLSAQGWVQRIILVILFAAVEFPGVLFFKDMSEPRIFGFPFAYGFMLIGWALLTITLLWCYFTNWGEPGPKKGGEQE